MKRTNKICVAVLIVAIIISVFCCTGAPVSAEYESGVSTTAYENNFTGNYVPEESTTGTDITLVDQWEKESMINDANEVINQTSNVGKHLLTWFKAIIDGFLSIINSIGGLFNK